MKKNVLAASAVCGLALIATAAYAGPFGIQVNVPNIPTPAVTITTNNGNNATQNNATQNSVEQSAGEQTSNTNSEVQTNQTCTSETPEARPNETTVPWEGWPNVAWTLDGMNPPRDGRLYLVEYTGNSTSPRYHAEGKHVVFENIKSGQCIAWANSVPGKVNAANFRAKNVIYLIAVYPGVGFDWYSLERSQCKSYADMAIRSTTPMRGKGMKFFDGLVK